MRLRVIWLPDTWTLIPTPVIRLPDFAQQATSDALLVPARHPRIWLPRCRLPGIRLPQCGGAAQSRDRTLRPSPLSGSIPIRGFPHCGRAEATMPSTSSASNSSGSPISPAPHLLCASSARTERNSGDWEAEYKHPPLGSVDGQSSAWSAAHTGRPANTCVSRWSQSPSRALLEQCQRHLARQQ